MTIQSVILSIFLLIFLPIRLLQAHEVWLEASPFHAKPNQSVDIGIYVGNNMVGEELPNLLDKYSDFSYFSAEGRRTVEGEIAAIPAGTIVTSQHGTYAVGYRSLGSNTELSAEKFTLYLQKEGLDKIVTLRKQRGQQDIPGKERFSRAVKTLIRVGDTQEHDFSSKEFGYKLELTPQANPYQLKLGDELPLFLQFYGKPLSNIRITAFTKEQPENKQQTTTDKNGHAAITLNQSGTWIIKAVEMLPAEKKDYDWESLWATLTFKLSFSDK